MAYQSTEIFRAISDPTRRAILDLLRDEGRTVQRLADGFDVSRPAISQHLKVLRDAGLVRERKEGRCRIYALNPQPLRTVDRWLEAYRRFWERNLLGLKEYVEAEERTDRRAGAPRRKKEDS
jgi:DNA-binding transcriptional ArsR family regulator